MLQKWSIRLLALIAAVAVFSALGWVFAAGTAAERNAYTMSLSNSETVATADLSAQLLPKKLIQPGYISFTSGHRGGITNDAGRAIKLRLEVRECPYEVKFSSLSNGFDGTDTFARPVEDGAQIALDVIVRIPRDEVKNVSGNSITVDFIDDETDETFTSLVLSFE